MSRRRHRPFWQDNVLHVPTSPFMSPVGSPAPSPVHSPLVSPPRTPTHLQAASYREESPDVASIILNALGDNSALTLDDILTTFITDNAPPGEEEEEENEEELTPADDNIDESVQRAYHRFVADLRRAETAAHHLLNLSSNDPSPPPPAPSASAAPPPPPRGTPRRRSPPPPPPRSPPPPSLRSRRRNAIFARRPPPLHIPGSQRDVVVPLSSGGFTFQSASSPMVISRTNTNRHFRRVRSRADLPLLRQYAAEATARSRERAHRRIVRFSRQLVQREDQQMSPPSSLGSAGGVSSFQLTEEFGIPTDKCAICLEEYRVGQNVSFVNCQPNDSSKDHLFHTICINNWIASLRRNGSAERTCPVCRGVF